MYLLPGPMDVPICTLAIAEPSTYLISLEVADPHTRHEEVEALLEGFEHVFSPLSRAEDAIADVRSGAQVQRQHGVHGVGAHSHQLREVPGQNSLERLAHDGRGIAATEGTELLVHLQQTFARVFGVT